MSTEQSRERARQRKANQRAREKGLPEPFPFEAPESKEDKANREQRYIADYAWAQEMDDTGKFYKSECRPALKLLAIYYGNPSVQEEEGERTDPKTGKKLNLPNPSLEAIRIRAILTTELTREAIESGELLVKIDPDMKQYRQTYEVNEVVTFREWLELRDKARKDLFWLGRLLERSFFHDTHQQMCDMFVKKNFDGLFFPDFNSDDVHDAIRAQKQYRMDANRNQTDTMMLFAPRSSYKSTIDGVDAVQWLINCPDTRIMILTSVLDLSKQFLKEIKSYFHLPMMAKPTPFQLLFPEYVLTGVKATSEQPIVCPARTYESREAHVWVTSLDASFVGQRCDIRKLDDCVDDKNSANEELRAKLTGKIASTNPLTEPWGFTDIIGTRYFTTDWYAHRMTSEDGEEVEPFAYLSLSAWKVKPEFAVEYEMLLSERNGMFKVRPEMVDLFFPSKLNFKELRKRLREYKERGFKNQYLNIATDPFEATDFAVHFDKAVLRSHTYSSVAAPSSGELIVVVDWAYSENKTSDYSVLAAVRRHEREDKTEELIVLDVDYDKWKSSDLAMHIVLFLRKHRPQRTFIEKSNGADLLMIALSMYAKKYNCEDVLASIKWVEVDNSLNAKANRVKTLELLLNDDRLHFVAGTWIDELYRQFERFTGETRKGRKDDIPDAISFASRTLPREMFVSIRREPELEASVAEEMLKKSLKQQNYNRYFGGPVYNKDQKLSDFMPNHPRRVVMPMPTQPTVPEKPKDPRLRLFGKGPWRL
jgi:hypothetical protein